jgi:hypothetical protein
VLTEDITKDQKLKWIEKACECEIVGPCMAYDWKTGKHLPDNYPQKWRVCENCGLEFTDVETRKLLSTPRWYQR